MATGYSVAIGVVDNATKQINAINKRIAAAQAPFNRLSGSISKFSDLSGITKVEQGIKSVVGYGERLLGTVGRLIPAFGLLTSAASIAGIYKLAEAFANLGNRLANDAAKIGTSAPNLQMFQNGARLAGVSAEDMTSSMEGLSTAMQEAMSQPTEASALFSKFGIDIRNSAYQAKSGAEKMGDAFEVIRKMNEAGASAASQRKAMAIMGLNPNMLRYAQGGRAGLERNNKEASDLGGLNQDQIDKAIALRKSITEVQEATENMANSIMASLSPALTPLLEQFAKWVASNQGYVQTKAAEYAKQFADWVSGIDWKQVHQSLDDFISRSERIVESLGGFKTLTEEILGLWIGAKVIGMIANLAKIASILLSPIPGGSIGAALAAATALGFKSQYDAGKRDIETGTKAEQMGFKPELTPGSTDENGHFMGNYINDAGKRMSPDEVDEEYRKRGGGSAGMPFGPTAPMSTKEMDASAKDAFDFWTSHGYSKAAAAGMVAQEQAESGFRPGARGDMGKAGGLFQWHQDRRDAILKGTGIDVYSEKDSNHQREAALWEQNNTEKSAGDRIKASATSAEAGANGSMYYERPGDRVGQAALRAAIARQRYDQFAPTAKPPQPATMNPAAPVNQAIPANPAAPTNQAPTGNPTAAPGPTASPLAQAAPATPPAGSSWLSNWLGLDQSFSHPADQQPSIVAPPASKPAAAAAPPAPAPAAAQNGKVDVVVTLQGSGADGAKVTAKTSGGAVNGAPSVVRPMSPFVTN